MIAQDLVQPGAAFVGADGEVRHVIIVHKPGSGYSVSWDSVPLDGKYWAGCVAGLHKTRPHGYMPMREFQKWAVTPLASQAASHDTQGAAPLTRCAAGRDGECGQAQCPQLRDGEPRATGRHCPLDQGEQN